MIGVWGIDEIFLVFLVGVVVGVVVSFVVVNWKTEGKEP